MLCYELMQAAHTPNPDYIRQHDKWYLQILDNVLMRSKYTETCVPGGFVKRLGSESENHFWHFLSCIDNADQEKLRSILLAAYSDEAKSLRGSPGWTTEPTDGHYLNRWHPIFSVLPSDLPEIPGTYVLETTSGYIFTGSSFGRDWGFSTWDQRYSGPPDLTEDSLYGLAHQERNFRMLADLGFKTLREPSFHTYNKATLNLWLLRECSGPEVDFQFHTLGVLPRSLLQEYGWVTSSRGGEDFMVRLMETIDTIYNGTIIDTDYGDQKDEFQLERAFARDLRPSDMPRQIFKGVNRTLACFRSSAMDSEFLGYG